MNQKNKEKILITGCAGFIGMHLCISLLKDGYKVVGIDNMNSYYEKSLKLDRLSRLSEYMNFSSEILDLNSIVDLKMVFQKFHPHKVVNLAAQAGVQYSLVNPNAYIESNILGFMNLLECCQLYDVNGLIYASSSSVYGGNTKTPFAENDNVDNPISIYAVTKKTNELMASVYHQLYGLNCTGLRFFTVYGPWGRPDMAYFIFTKKILKGEKIAIFDNGKVERDFTYIDDIIEGIRSAIDKNFANGIFNLGNNKKEKVISLVRYIEQKIGKKANIVFKPIKPGDIRVTNADITKSINLLGYKPKVNLRSGVDKFITWYIDYYKV